MSTIGKLRNCNDNTPSPLIGEHVKVKIFDFCAEVEIYQRFVNLSSSPLEAYYQFSIPEGAAVHNFLAIVGDAIIETKLKEKEQAKDVYDDAIASGKTSVLLEQEGDNLFKTNIGNLSPDQECVTVISIACELQFNVNKELEFTLQNDRTSTSYIKRNTTGDNLVPPGFKIDINLEMTSKISSIQSTLGNKTSNSGKSAEISMYSEKPLDSPFQLQILLEEPNKPTFRVQGDVGMLSLYPQIELEDGEDPITEMIFLVDRSSSMRGPNISSAKDTLLIFLKSLPLGTLFNIVGFGTRIEFLFKNGSKEYDSESLREAEQLVTKMEANLGGTELLPPLREILSKPPKEGIPRQLFVLTDGQVRNTQECIDFVRKHANTTRVFAFGIQGASPALVNGIAKAGEGKAELIGEGGSVESKVMAQLKRALQLALTDIKLDWGSLQVKQTPFFIPPVFNGSRLILYGYIDSANMHAGNVTFIAKCGQKDYSFSLLADPQVKVTGECITALAARSMIRDLEEGRSAYHTGDFLEEKIKEKIIELSLRTGVISKHTAFVGAAIVQKAPVTNSRRCGVASHSVAEIQLMDLFSCYNDSEVETTEKKKRREEELQEKGKDKMELKRKREQRMEMLALPLSYLERETKKLQKKGKEKEEEKGTSNLNLKDILISQTATGTFPEETLKLLGTTLEYLRSNASLTVLQLSPVLSDQILICIYVCGFIRLHYPHVADQWELVVKKSVNWIKKECKKAEDPQNTLHNFAWLELGVKLASM